MSAQIIDGKAVAGEIKQQVKQSLSELLSKDMRVPVLAVVLVGEDPASEVYVGHKKRACTEVGIGSITHQLPAETTEQQLLTLIHNLNNDVNVDGILVQLPLPDHLDSTLVINSIRPDKDVDGFHPENVGKLALRMPGIRSCTPYGVIKLLDSVGQKYKGEHAVVVGASNIVGRPMMLELLLAGATVTICHRFTPNTPELVRQADIVVVAVGVPGFLKGDWVKPGATIIDVGINRLEDGSLSGDVDYTAAAEKAAYITPVPGGVGPMTVAMLMHNTLKAYQVRMAASPSE